MGFCIFGGEGFTLLSELWRADTQIIADTCWRPCWHLEPAKIASGHHAGRSLLLAAAQASMILILCSSVLTSSLVSAVLLKFQTCTRIGASEGGIYLTGEPEPQCNLLLTSWPALNLILYRPQVRWQPRSFSSWFDQRRHVRTKGEGKICEDDRSLQPLVFAWVKASWNQLGQCSAFVKPVNLSLPLPGLSCHRLCSGPPGMQTGMGTECTCFGCI